LERATAAYAQFLPVVGSYLAERGISESVARTFRLGVVAEPEVGHEMYEGRLAIPYLTRAGVVSLKFRCIIHEDCKAVDCPKYLGLSEATHMFNVNSFFEDSTFIAIAEGEIDAMVLSGLAGVPAVAIPGVKNWKPHYERCFVDYERVYVFADGDAYGKDFAKQLSHLLDGVTTVQMPTGMDVNEVYLQEGAEGLRKRAGL
jgi:DNA primase